MMKNRIDLKFEELRARGQKALIIFMTAGDPDWQKNYELAIHSERAGVDLIELGVPFSDPQADGPVIQASSARSLKKGTSLKKVLALAKRIRWRSQIPLVLMGYYNPFYQYGLERFAKEARASGVDGVIVPDLTAEESGEFNRILKKNGLHLIYFVAPTSNRRRIEMILRHAGGFLYYVSVTGVTGVKKAAGRNIKSDLKKINHMSRLPVCVGFGVSTPLIAKQVSRVCDGVIVGSTLVNEMVQRRNLTGEQVARLTIRPFARAIGKRV